MKTLEREKTIRVGDRILTIVERTMLSHCATNGSFVVSARKGPSTILVREKDREYTLSLDGTERVKPEAP